MIQDPKDANLTTNEKRKDPSNSAGPIDYLIASLAAILFGAIFFGIMFGITKLLKLFVFISITH